MRNYKITIKYIFRGFIALLFAGLVVQLRLLVLPWSFDVVDAIFFFIVAYVAFICSGPKRKPKTYRKYRKNSNGG